MVVANAGKAALKPWGGALLDLFWPPHCCGCGAATEGTHLCERCSPVHPVVTSPFCEVCSQPFPGGHEGFVCGSCRDRSFHFVCSLSPVLAHGHVREMVHRLKYSGERWLANPLADWMSACLLDHRIQKVAFDALVPVPLYALRMRERGYNQAELLAARFGAKSGFPVWNVLRRIHHTETQTHFDRSQRMKNLRGAFVCVKPQKVAGKRLLLVDDVFTTGSTLDECSKTLLEAGADAVWCITAARA